MFPHRRPCLEARRRMSDSALALGTKACCAPNHEETRNAVRAISKATRHKYVKLVSTGDAAVFAAVKAVDGKIMIPDQGGWKGFKEYPKILGRETCEVETNLGLIDPNTLSEAIKKHKPAALFVTSFAGYIAEQDIHQISKVCRENGVLLVEDASGAIGDSKLVDGRYSDVIVCSAGTPKILNLVNGGFISTNDAEILGKAAAITSACKLSPIVCAGIIEELKNSRLLVETLIKYAAMLKEELPGVVHRNRRGVCAGFLEENPKQFAFRAREKGLITDFNQSFLTTCPNYERFLKNGIVVELKKLDILSMTEEDILKIADIIKSLIP